MPLITLTKTSTEFGEISIVQSRVAGSHVYWQEGWAQSEADRNGVSLAAYVHAIFRLVAQTSAHATLMIGCGGGTLGTMLIDAGRSVIVVDINPQSIALARQYFSLPEHVAYHVEDGESFLKRNQTIFDAVIIDAFIEAKVPRHFAPWNSFASSENAWLMRRTPASTCAYWCHPVERNAIVMGGAVATLHERSLLMKPEVLKDEIMAELQGMRFRGNCRSWNSPTADESDCSEQTP
jgi:2-polyprenyl-3-methyl-5-hydroxy-6-metoxy-1,4-benzoquinol methylase